MTIVVPFDGSELSTSALVRATVLGEAFDENILAVTIVPNEDAEFAREHGWLNQEAEYDHKTVIRRIHKQVSEVAPDAEIRHEFVGRYAPTGRIAKKLRKIAKEADASVVVIGSDNAGHMVTSIDSIGSTIAADDAFDVVIVRRPISAESGSSENSGW